jgi:hypothetical protein
MRNPAQRKEENSGRTETTDPAGREIFLPPGGEERKETKPQKTGGGPGSSNCRQRERIVVADQPLAVRAAGVPSKAPNHALQRTGTAALRTAVNRPLSLVSLGYFEDLP